MLQKERDSSFELLRIFSMLLIVMHHYSVHGGFDFYGPFNLNLYFVQCLGMGGKLGVNLFVLISGFFLCKSEFRWKRIIKLELEVIFYSVMIGIIFFFFLPEQESVKELLKEFFPLRSNRYWFYNTYFVLVLLCPFINKLIALFGKEFLRKILLCIFILWVLIPVLPKVLSSELSNLSWFIFLYLCAAYIRFYQDDFKISNKTCISLGFAVYALVLISVLFFDLHGFIDKRFQAKFNYFLPMDSILIFTSSIMLFLGFSKINIGRKKCINIFSSSTFGIYLIHDNHLVRPFLWNDLFKNTKSFYSNRIFLHAFITISLVYISCTVIDLLRQYLFEKPVFLIVDKIIRCDNKMENT